MKRTFDLLVAILGLCVIAPLLAVVAILIKVDSRGPVLYSAARAGLRGKEFRMFKFRTMVRNEDKIGAASTPNDDPRITRIGKLLRKYKLDELPQLFNVVRGDMSLVGPRPQVLWAVQRYTEEERAVLDVRPGMTDYASLRFRDEGEILRGSKHPDKDYFEKIHPEKMRLSMEYVKKRSFFLDCRILTSTLVAVIFPSFQRRAPDKF